MKFDNAVVAVTGAARGIGLAFAKRALAMGAKVALSDIDARELASVERSLRNDGASEVLVGPCDVGSDDSVRAWSEAVLARFGRIDLLVNNAAALNAGPGSLAEIKLEDYRLGFEVNVLGNLRTIQAFLPTMRAKGTGHIVNTASALAIRPNAVVQHLIPYVTSKGAVVTQTWALAHALGQSGVKVSLFCPGLTATRPGEMQSQANGWFAGVREEVAQAGTLAAAIDILVEGLRRDDFLICSEFDYADSLVRFARNGLDPLSDFL